MRYIIDAPSNLYKIDGTLRVPVKVGEGDLCWYNTYLKVESYTEPDRRAIEDEVWEFLDFLFTGMNSEERYECFDMVFSHMIVSNMSYQEAKAKYEAWKKKDEFKIGDEIKSKTTGNVGVVIEVNKEHEYVNVIFPSGTPWNFHFEEIEKTGIYFSEALELMKKIRGEEQ